MKIAAIVVNQKLYLWLAGTAPNICSAPRRPSKLLEAYRALESRIIYTALFNKSLTETHTHTGIGEEKDRNPRAEKIKNGKKRQGQFLEIK